MSLFPCEMKGTIAGSLQGPAALIFWDFLSAELCSGSEPMKLLKIKAGRCPGAMAWGLAASSDGMQPWTLKQRGTDVVGSQHEEASQRLRKLRSS